MTLRLVFIHALRVQAVPTTAGDGIVQGDLQIIVSQEPVEGSPRFLAPTIVSSYAIGFETSRNRAARFKGLFDRSGLAHRPCGKTLANRRARSDPFSGNVVFRRANPALRGRWISCGDRSCDGRQSKLLAPTWRLSRLQRLQTSPSLGTDLRRGSKAMQQQYCPHHPPKIELD